MGGAVLLAVAYTSQRAKLTAADQRIRDLDSANAVLQGQMKQMRFSKNNKLYRHSVEEQGYALEQSLIRLRVLQAEFDEATTAMAKLMTAAKE